MSNDEDGLIRLRPGLELIEIGNRRLVVVALPAGGNYYRMDRAEARLLFSLADLPINSLSPEGRRKLEHFSSLGLISDMPALTPAPVGSPSRATGRTSKLMASLSHRIATFVVSEHLPGTVSLGCIGFGSAIVLLTTNWYDVLRASREVSASALCILVLATLIVIGMHELAHAVVLIRLGGNPREFGFALVNFMPAFFCDTTELWRLPRRRDRVSVLLAGVYVNFLLGATALLAFKTLNPGSPAWRWTAMFGVVNLGLAGFNLIPFLKVDGYLVLEAALSWPGLREDCTRYVWTLISGALRGNEAGKQCPTNRRLAYLTFGILCAMTPPLMAVGGLAVLLMPLVR